MNFLFDCDDTLYDLQEPFIKTLKDLDLVISHDDLDRFYHNYRSHGDKIFDQVQKGKISVDESGMYRILAACKDFSIPFTKDQAILFQQRYRLHQNEISLSKLFRDFFKNTQAKLGILTNGEDAHQKEKLYALGVDAFIPMEHIFTSGQIGYQKPDVRAFRYALDHMHAQAPDWCYVGDRYDFDISPAKQVGMHTIHFNRHHRQEGCMSDHTVYSEEALIQVLKALEKEEDHA